MSKVSTGINDLDGLIDSAHIGDNVIWEVEAGTSSEVFVGGFVRQAHSEGQNIIYVNFNRSPQSVIQSLNAFPSEGFFLIDCFTSGKGKNDKAFMHYYEKNPAANVKLVERPGDMAYFTNMLNSIEDNLPAGAKYVFDSLTGMQDLWDGEEDTYKFFTYMCPRLYDLDTVAYWILEKDAHSQAFKANLRHITQVVLDLYKRKDSLYIKALKLDGRKSRDAFRPHLYRIDDDTVRISSINREQALDIGPRIRDMRIARGMSQKELAERVDLTASFISQLENNQISPSLNSFLHICGALGINPGDLWSGTPHVCPPWLIRKEKTFSTPVVSEKGLKGFSIASNGASSGTIFSIEPDTVIKKHLSGKGKQLVYVLKGSVTVEIGGKEERLITGDSVYLKNERPSMWKNSGDDKVELLLINF